MKRQILSELAQWQKSSEHMPLLLPGAKQVQRLK